MLKLSGKDVIFADAGGKAPTGPEEPPAAHRSQSIMTILLPAPAVKPLPVAGQVLGGSWPKGHSCSLRPQPCHASRALGRRPKARKHPTGLRCLMGTSASPNSCPRAAFPGTDTNRGGQRHPPAFHLLVQAGKRRLKPRLLCCLWPSHGPQHLGAMAGMPAVLRGISAGEEAFERPG